MDRVVFAAMRARMEMTFTRVLLCLLLFGGRGGTYQPYDDSTLTLTSFGTPDPFVNSFRGQYYLTFTAGDRIELWSSNSLVDIEASATKHRIWQPPHGTDHSVDIWAPELHAIRGRWYIYYAAASRKRGNKSHRMYVLGGPPATEEPCSGPWEFIGRIHDMPDQWAIDGTVFELEGQLYLAYSGWPLDSEAPGSDQCEMRPRDPAQHSLSDKHENKHHGHHSNSNATGVDLQGNETVVAAAPRPGLVQHLYIIRLDDPSTAGSRPVAVSLAQEPWEITRGHNGAYAINEGPQWLSSPDGRWRGLVYSCAGSWTHDYKMATLKYRGGEPLDPASWQKSKAPLLQRNRRAGAGLFGPGHGSFLDVGGGNVVAVYHATDGPDDGWENRRARVQRVAFTEKGPYMGKSFGVEGPAAAEGLMARIRAKIGVKTKRKTADGTEDLRTFLEARRIENEARADEM